jgi:hypothetical protein
MRLSYQHSHVIGNAFVGELNLSCKITGGSIFNPVWELA